MNNLIVTMWEKDRHFYEASLAALSSENHHNRLSPDTSTAGFLAQHIAESMLYCCMLLGNSVQLPELVTIGVPDSGQCEDLAKVRATFHFAMETMSETVRNVTDEDMHSIIDTFLGPISKIEFIGFTLHHASYHLGQASYAMKRGRAFATTAAAA